MTWLLDANVLIRAQDAGLLEALLDAAVLVPCAIAKEVHEELCGRGSRKRSSKHAKVEKLLSAKGPPVHDVPLDSKAAIFYTALRAGRTTPADAGECQSIALALENGDFLFVTGEPKAGWLGLLELEDRARALPSFLHQLVSARALSKADANSILATAQARSGVRRPTWWPY